MLNITDEKIEEYRSRIKEGNRYMDGPLVGIEVDFFELSRYEGIRLIYKDTKHIGYEFGYRNRLYIERLLDEFGY